MAEITRRTFVKSGACALVALAGPPRFLVRTACAAEPGRRRVLVAVFQRGAVDGLSMVVPHGDPAYYAARSSIALARPAGARAEGAVDLDGFFGLHPSLAPLKGIWDAGALAIIHACGSPHATRSHFEAQDYMEAGTPGLKSTPDGWLNRALKGRPATSPFRAVALSPALPRSLRGEAPAVAMTQIEDFGLKAVGGAEPARRGFEALYGQAVRDVLYGGGRETFEAAKLLEKAAPARIAPAPGAQYPGSRFGENLRQVAQLIKADIGLEVAFTEMGGWDTHAGQGNDRGQLALRFGEFGAALAAFYRDLGDRMADVVVLTMSEFGRTVRENGNRGTDHGHGTAMLVMGGRVRGGKVYGRWPGLEAEQLFERRDLAVTTDFRVLFAEVAGRHLGLASTAGLFPGFPLDATVPLGLMG
jgi:uncharacterized protein (DUF1501 family)